MNRSSSDPGLLLLDEPTSALDPLGRRQVREILLELRAQGKTIFLNSHLLSEIELVCDQVAVIRSGEIVASGTLGELLASSLEAEVRLRQDDAAALAALAAMGRICGRDDLGAGLIRVRVGLDRPDDVPALAAAVVAAGGHLHGLQAHARSLEDLFVDLVEGPPSRL